MSPELLSQGERKQPETSGHQRYAALIIIGLVALFTGVVAYFANHRAQQDAPIQEGLAPPFKLPRYGGGTVSLADLRGKVVMLNFWATWCAPCVAEMPALTKLAHEYEPKGLAFLAVSLDERETASAQVGSFVAQIAPNLASNIVFADEKIVASYEVEDLPMMTLIGRDGRILESYNGYTSESTLRQKIESALAK